MLLHEYEAREKRRKFMRTATIIAVIFTALVTAHVVNIVRSENIRQMYIHSIVSNLHNLEVVLFGFYHNIEDGQNPFEAPRWSTFDHLTQSIDSDIRRLAMHRNVRSEPIGMSRTLRFHLTTLLIDEANNGQPEAAQEFISRRSEELRELISDLSIESEEERHGEIVSITKANTNMTTRQIFNRINTFTQCVDDEQRDHHHRQHRN